MKMRSGAFASCTVLTVAGTASASPGVAARQMPAGSQNTAASATSDGKVQFIANYLSQTNAADNPSGAHGAPLTLSGSDGVPDQDVAHEVRRDPLVAADEHERRHAQVARAAVGHVDRTSEFALRLEARHALVEDRAGGLPGGQR